MHDCDQPLCIWPRHLRVGTQAENQHDKAARGRAASGERNGRAKLSENDVESIRDALARGATKRGLGRDFGVSDTLIRMIAKGDVWLTRR